MKNAFYFTDVCVQNWARIPRFTYHMFAIKAVDIIIEAMLATGCK